MGKPFSIPLVADVRAWLKGTSDVEESLGKVSDSLNELANETSADADKAADKLEGKFTGAFDKVKTEAKTAGDAVGDNIKHGTDKASEATDNMKESAHQNAREVAASFDGSAQSLVQGFQGAAAEMFDGFGPAGAAAGLAIAAGMGIASAALSQADEDAKAAKEATLELGKALATATTRAQGLADATADAISEATKNPQNIIDAMFGNDATDRLTLYSDVIRNAGLSYNQVLKAMQGDDEAYQQVVTQAWAKTDQAHEQSTISFLDDLNKRNQASKDAAVWAEEYAQSGVKAAQDRAQAEADAAQKSADAAQTLKESYSDAIDDAVDNTETFVRKNGQKWKDFQAQIHTATTSGKLDVEEWYKGVERAQKQNAHLMKFDVLMESKLSPEAYQKYEQMGRDDRIAFMEAYNKGAKTDQALIVKGFEIQAGHKDGKKPTVEVDTKVNAPSKADIAAATAEATRQAADHGVHLDTTVSKDDAKNQTNDAANAAHSEANKDSNKITFNTRIDHDELQRQVNRAAASITPPTITVKTRVQKEVP